MFLNKEFYCEKCKKLINKKTCSTIDYSHQGKMKYKPQIRVCQNCCLEELVDVFQNHTKRAIIVQPSSKYNAYVFYSFKDMFNPSKEEEFDEYLLSLLPQNDEKCEFCSEDALYTWCTLSMFCGDDPFSSEVPDERPNYICVCPNCLARLYKEKMITENINLKYIAPMINEDGYCTPWDA